MVPTSYRSSFSGTETCASLCVARTISRSPFMALSRALTDFSLPDEERDDHVRETRRRLEAAEGDSFW